MLLFLVIILYLSSAGMVPPNASDCVHLGTAPETSAAVSATDDPADFVSQGEIPPAHLKRRPANTPPAPRLHKDDWQTGEFTTPDAPSGKYCEGALSGAALAAYPT